MGYIVQIVAVDPVNLREWFISAHEMIRQPQRQRCLSYDA
jgi:hypothetical protein